MALSRFGFLVCGPGLDPACHRTSLVSPGFTMVTLGVTDPVVQGPAAARRLIDEDRVQLVELCGGFGPLGTAAVLAAVDGRVPVGSVAYGPESIDLMHHLFATT